MHVAEPLRFRIERSGPPAHGYLAWFFFTAAVASASAFFAASSTRFIASVLIASSISCWGMKGDAFMLLYFSCDCTGATDYGNHLAAIKMIKMQGGVFGAVSNAKALVEALP